MLKIGEKAPNFTLNTSEGKIFDLYTERIGKPCIIYFYPKDFTPGCIIEACNFRDHFDFFKNLDIDIIGISKDSEKSHARFKEKYQLPFTLLSDPEGMVCDSYGALVPFINIPKRVSYLLNSKLEITYIYQNFFGAHLHIKKMLKTIG